MKLTIVVKLDPNAEQELLIVQTLTEYTRTMNTVLTDMIDYDQRSVFTSKMVDACLPSCLRCQAARDAKAMNQYMFKHHCGQPVLKKKIANWNNQNYIVSADSIAFPVWKDGKSCRIRVKAIIPSEIFEKIQHVSLGAMRITKKNNKLIAQIAYEAESSVINTDRGVMGIDLGIKCPAVSVTSDGKVHFFGNGRKNKYVKRHFQSKRQKLQKKKKMHAVRKMEDKEHRVLKDIDHKLSREIVNYAVLNGVKTIQLETLAGIRRTTRKSRKNNRSLNTWSFYRLQQFIKYKAALADIEVIEVDPAYTSQTCPNCGKLNHADDRSYSCECGFRCHRDIVGALNILCA